VLILRQFISIELQKYTTVCNKKDKALIVHLFQKHNLDRIIQMVNSKVYYLREKSFLKFSVCSTKEVIIVVTILW